MSSLAALRSEAVKDQLDETCLRQDLLEGVVPTDIDWFPLL
jgi:hypothetical protein